MKRKLMVIGTSAGGVEALKVVLNGIKRTEMTSIIVVIHIETTIEPLMEIYHRITGLNIKEAENRESIKDKDWVYFAPPGYHLSIEEDYSFSLAIEEKVNFARPSIDLLFMTAAEVYKEALTGIILTGANKDGAAGLKRVEELGGKCIVQSPEEAFMDMMPLSAIQEVENPLVMTLDEINDYIKKGDHLWTDI